jgi:NADH-quinone oxidoreductase subunit I
MPYTVDNRAPDLREQMYFPEILRGLGLAARHFFKNLFFARDANPDLLERDRSLNWVQTVQYPGILGPRPGAGSQGTRRAVTTPSSVAFGQQTTRETVAAPGSLVLR